MPADPFATLAARVEQAGGSLQRASRRDWTRAIEWPLELDAVEQLFLGAGVAEQTAGALSPRGVGVTARQVHALAPLEICVLRAELAVVENGAVWQRPASSLERAAALLAEHLIVLVDETALAPTLHQAYQRIDLETTGFGWFLCGPSKTADIEQVLVLGAHGPRTMSLVALSQE
jgi:L-lactate dehydrogenase complex protein LldG